MIKITKTQDNKTYEIVLDESALKHYRKYNWHVRSNGHTAYLYRCSVNKAKKRTTVSFHREVIDAPRNLVVDHINGNGLDNRKENLRLATRSQNNMNMKKRKTKTSKYKGVNYCKKYKRWRMQIKLNGKRKANKLYKTENEAAEAYNKAALELFGDFASLNVIE